MTHIHYKFSSKLSYDTVVFDGPHITLKDLKRQIMGREKLRAGDCDLQITDAQTKEEYTDEEGLIHKGSSVIVRRIPLIGGKSGSHSKNRNAERSDVHLHHALGAIKAMDDQNSTRAIPLFSKMANLADVEGTEEDKIQVMINQSSYDTMNHNKKFSAALPSNYTCYRCGMAGHHIRHCPTIGQDKNAEAPVRIRKSTGIPRSFMVEVDDPSIKGAMLTNFGRYAVPAIDAEAYAIGKKERPPFFPLEQPKSEDEEDPVPGELVCLICHDLLTDAVVIPCCGNSYCDDCIRSTLLDSEEHVCPTCDQCDVSPDTLIANRFLRQAVNTFKKERGHTKSLKGKGGSSESQNATPTLSPVPTPPPPTLQIQMMPKPYQPSHSQQDPLRSNAADSPQSSQVCVASPIATDPASAYEMAGTSPQTVQSQLETPNKEPEEKTHENMHYDSADASPTVEVSHKDLAAAPSPLIPLVTQAPAAEQPQAVVADLQQSASATGPTARRSRPSTCWDSSSSTPGGPTGVRNESHTQRPPSSSSSSSPYPATPPPLFPSPHFHTFLTQQPPCGYPPGYHPSPSPVWALPTPRGAPIPSLCSVTSTATIPTLIPKEWYRPHKKKERSPHRGSTYRRSSSGSYSKSLKSKSSRPYSPSSSRSRSPSRSQGRSRPNSHYRDPHPRSHSSHSYSYGFKRSRSPTPSSSSSPKVGYHSRSKSPADHCNKKSYHGRHHNRKSTSSGYSSRRRGESSQSEAGGSGGSMAGYLYHPHASQSSSLELDRERYLQWKHEYKEWCEKYFSSYVGHFHQMPPPLLSYPPPLLPPHWDRGGSRNPSHHAKSESRNRNQARRPALMDVRSPQSQSSSDSRSPLSQSSSDSCSTASQSFSDTRSSPSHSSQDSRSPPSHSSSDGRSTPSQDAAQPGTSYGGLPNTLAKGSEGEEGELQEKSKDDKLKLIGANSEKRTTFKHKQNLKKKHEEGSRNKSSVPIAVEPNYDVEKEKKRGYAGPNDSVNGSPVPEEGSDPEALESLQPLEKPDKRLDEDRERNSREQRNWEMERGRRRGKHSDRQDGERRHREKPCKEAGRLDTDRHRKPGAGSKASDSRSDQKRRADDAERSAVGKAQSSKCPKAKMAEDPHTNKMESPDPIDRKKQKTEKKRERKTLHPNREMDIWEGGMKVKPQAKISININLDGKGKDEKLEKQDLCYSESLTGKTMEVFEKTTEMRVNEKKESSTDQDVVLKDAIKPDEGEARPLWEKATFRDDQGEVRENVAGDKKDIGENSPEEGELEDFDSWQCEEKESGRRRSRQQEKKGGMEASSVVGVTNNGKRSVRGGQAEKGRGRNDSRGRELVPGVTILPKERTAGENTCKEDGVRGPGKSKPNEELMEGARWRLREEEEEEEDDSRNQNHHYRANTPLEDSSSYEDNRERKTVVQTLDENSQDNATDQEDQLVLIQVPRSKWEKDESEEEEEDEGEIKVSIVADTAAHRETDEENEQNSQKSVELEKDGNRAIERGMVREKETNSILSGSHRSVAPSSGKGVSGSTLCPNKDTERRMEPDGPRDRERGKESERRRERQKESRRSEDGRREEKKGRAGEKERGQKRNLPPSSHHYSNSTSHDTERRDRQRGETGRDHSHYYFNQQVPSENHRHHSPTTSIPHGQGKERELTPDRSRRESKAERRERKQNKADRGMKVDQEMAAKRRGGVGRCEDEADGQAELEEGEKSSSNSVGSSAGQQSSRDDRRKERKKSNKEKREAVLELPQEGQLKKHKKSTEGRRDRGEKEEEEDCSKLCSIMSS